MCLWISWLTSSRGLRLCDGCFLFFHENCGRWKSFPSSTKIDRSARLVFIFYARFSLPKEPWLDIWWIQLAAQVPSTSFVWLSWSCRGTRWMRWRLMSRKQCRWIIRSVGTPPSICMGQFYDMLHSDWHSLTQLGRYEAGCCRNCEIMITIVAFFVAKPLNLHEFTYFLRLARELSEWCVLHIPPPFPLNF